MPPLIAFAGALGSAAVVRWVYRTVRKINVDIDEARSRRLAEAEPAATDRQTLRRDPQTGAYRPG